MNDSGREGDAPNLQRLSSVVNQRADRAIWRAFLVAQVSVRETNRRREMTTQRIFLLGQRER
jgi:hypothetical protein